MVMRPVLLRPPLAALPSVSFLTGRPFHSSERSISTTWRRPGVIGRKDLSAIAIFPVRSDRRRDVDGLALGQRHDRLLPVRALAQPALEALFLAADVDRVDGLDLDVE